MTETAENLAARYEEDCRRLAYANTYRCSHCPYARRGCRDDCNRWPRILIDAGMPVDKALAIAKAWTESTGSANREQGTEQATAPMKNIERLYHCNDAFMELCVMFAESVLGELDSVKAHEWLMADNVDVPAEPDGNTALAAAFALSSSAFDHLVAKDGTPIRVGESFHGCWGDDWRIVGLMPDKDYRLLALKTAGNITTNALYVLKPEWLTRRQDSASDRGEGKADHGQD